MAGHRIRPFHMKRIVSVSLGSSRRDKRVRVHLLGQEFEISRVGADGKLGRMASLIGELDGQVDFITLGGIPVRIVLKNGAYPFRDAAKLIRLAKETPVIDGERVRSVLESHMVRELVNKGMLNNGMAVFFPIVMNRIGMASTMETLGFERMRFGDPMFILGIPGITLSSLTAFNRIARVLSPLAAAMPYQWFYPTGAEQEEFREAGARHFLWADVLAGDFHNIRRHLPPALDGKIVLTNTVTADDRHLLRSRGAALLITTGPSFDGRAFGSNVINGVICSLLDRLPHEISDQEYVDVAQRAGIVPGTERLDS